MTLEEGTDIESMFRLLYAKLSELPGFLICDGLESLEDGYYQPSWSVHYMQRCCFDEFSDAVELMREAKEAEESARKRPARY